MYPVKSWKKKNMYNISTEKLLVGAYAGYAGYAGYGGPPAGGPLREPFKGPI